MNTTTKPADAFLAQRVLGAKPSATKEMTRLANQLKRERGDVIALSQGEPDFPTPEHVREAAKAALDRNESLDNSAFHTHAALQADASVMRIAHTLSVGVLMDGGSAKGGER